MSVFTTELRYICESLAGLQKSVGYKKVSEVIEAARPQIFEFDYPIFEQSYKPELETKIIKHFYTQEICAETFGLWQLYLDRKMNEIMPYYNQLYKSALIEYDPLEDTNLTRHSNRDTVGERTDKNTFNSTTDDTTVNTNDHTDKFWDTPQDELTAFENNTYLTDIRNIRDNGNNKYDSQVNQNSDNVSNSTNKDDFWETVKGKSQGKSYAQMINELRSTFLNIDMMVINELKVLFMGLYNTTL